MRGQSPQQKFVKVTAEMEKKVRTMLESTELHEISKTARIVVEIVKDNEPSPSALVTKRIDPQPRNSTLS